MVDPEGDAQINDEELSDIVLSLLAPETNPSFPQNEFHTTQTYATRAPNQLGASSNAGFIDFSCHQTSNSGGESSQDISQRQLTTAQNHFPTQVSDATYNSLQNPQLLPSYTTVQTSPPAVLYSNAPTISVLPRNQQGGTRQGSNIIDLTTTCSQFVTHKVNVQLPSQHEMLSILDKPVVASEHVTASGIPRTEISDKIGYERVGSKECGTSSKGKDVRNTDDLLAFKRARNRKYAKKSRDRKQTQLALMEDRLNKLQTENEMLKSLLRMQHLDKIVSETTSKAEEALNEDTLVPSHDQGNKKKSDPVC